MQIEHTRNFTELYRDVKQKQADQGYKAGKHLRFDDQNKAKGLYIHTGVSRARIFDWSGKHAARRAAKQADAGQHVWQSIANQHGEDVANGIFRNVLRSERGDHRASITMGDLDRIQRALPQQLKASEVEQTKQDAIRLAASDSVLIEDVVEHFEKNLELYSSDEFAATDVAKFRPEQFRPMQAMAFYDQVSAHGYAVREFAGFLKAVDVEPNGLPDNVPHEVRKQWMAKRVFETFFPKNSRFELNFRGEARQEFENKYRKFQGSADEKIAMMREKFLEISSQDGRDMVKGLAIGIAEMQGIENASHEVNEAVDFERNTGAPNRDASLTSRICSVKNKELVRGFLPGTREFNNILRKAGWHPQLVQHTEKRYISNRLRGLAELEAQAGNEVDRTWVERQIKGMLKELDGPVGSTGSALPSIQHEADLAAGEMLNAFLDTRSMSLPDLNAKVLEFQERSAKLTHVRRPNFGPQDVVNDHKLLLLRAAGRLRNRSHLDPLANLSTLLRTAYAAMADPRTDGWIFDDNSRISQIGPQMTEYVSILQFAVDQVQIRKGKPTLRAEFVEQRSLAEQAARNQNARLEIPGVPQNVVRQTVDLIVTRGLEAVERRERQESISEFEPPDEFEN